ncbi:hypothetical protein [Ureaplasma canigenitalium]|uniref:hypothetical protein n=1 Tax=Ureaplasma canigenitalium TaxID=42092 RepID=UPI0004E2800F|nr:hypothetical protein [Ureaplasma canigenitalium]
MKKNKHLILSTLFGLGSIIIFSWTITSCTKKTDSETVSLSYYEKNKNILMNTYQKGVFRDKLNSLLQQKDNELEKVKKLKKDDQNKKIKQMVDDFNYEFNTFVNETFTTMNNALIISYPDKENVFYLDVPSSLKSTDLEIKNDENLSIIFEHITKTDEGIIVKYKLMKDDILSNQSYQFLISRDQFKSEPKIDFDELNKNTTVTYHNANKTSFKDVSFKPDAYSLKNDDPSVKVEFINASLNENGTAIAVKYKLSKRKQESGIYTFYLNQDLFLKEEKKQHLHPEPNWDELSKQVVVTYKNSNTIPIIDAKLKKDFYLFNSPNKEIHFNFIEAILTIGPKSSLTVIYTMETDGYRSKEYRFTISEKDFKSEDDVAFEAASKTVSVIYINSEQTLFSEALTDKNQYKISSPDFTFTLKIVDVKKDETNLKIIVSYKMSKYGKESKIFTYDIPSSQFKQQINNEQEKEFDQVAQSISVFYKKSDTIKITEAELTNEHLKYFFDIKGEYGEQYDAVFENAVLNENQDSIVVSYRLKKNDVYSKVYTFTIPKTQFKDEKAINWDQFVTNLKVSYKNSKDTYFYVADLNNKDNFLFTGEDVRTSIEFKSAKYIEVNEGGKLFDRIEVSYIIKFDQYSSEIRTIQIPNKKWKKVDFKKLRKTITISYPGSQDTTINDAKLDEKNFLFSTTDKNLTLQFVEAKKELDGKSIKVRIRLIIGNPETSFKKTEIHKFTLRSDEFKDDPNVIDFTPIDSKVTVTYKDASTTLFSEANLEEQSFTIDTKDMAVTVKFVNATRNEKKGEITVNYILMKDGRESPVISKTISKKLFKQA